MSRAGETGRPVWDGDAPLIVSATVREDLRRLRERAAKEPLDLKVLAALLSSDDEAGKQRHREATGRRMVIIPGPFKFYVILSYETHPDLVGTVLRHMSMSIDRPGRIPSPEAMRVVAKLIGFEGEPQEWKVWQEPLSNGNIGVNIMQPITLREQSVAMN